MCFQPWGFAAPCARAPQALSTIPGVSSVFICCVCFSIAAGSFPASHMEGDEGVLAHGAGFSSHHGSENTA